MSNEIAMPRSDPPPAPDTRNDEDSGRLVNASTGRLVAIVTMLVLFCEIVPLQITMFGAVTPKIGASFPSAGANTSWVLTITGIVGGATLALVGKAADLIGKKKVLILVTIFFLAGSVLCAVTDNWGLFLLGRGLQALCLGISAVSYGMIRDLMPRRWIPVCVGFLGTGFGVAGLAAPLIGGALSDHFGWRSICWFLVIYLAATIPLFAIIVPESPVRVRQRFDWAGTILFGVAMGGILIYLSEGADWGWSDLGALAYLIAGVVALVAFIAWERHTPDPMMELSLLRAPKVSIVMMIAATASIVLSLPNFLIPYMFETPHAQDIIQQAAAAQHIPAAYAGQLMHIQGDISYAGGFSVFELAWHIVIFTAGSSMIFGPIGGLIARRIGSRLPMIIGSAALAAAFVLWWQFHKTWQDQAFIGLLWGLGFGFYYAASPNLLMDAVPAKRQGISASMLAAFGGIGGSVGTAVITPILASHPAKLVVTPPGAAPIVANLPQVYTDEAFSQAYVLVGVVAGLLTLALALALRTGRTPARGGAAVPATATAAT